MKEWTFKVFIKQNGDDAFEEWMKEQDAETQERVRARLDMMSITKTWKRPYFDVLHKHKHKHIYEIIVKGRDRQYRPLGCFGIGHVFILLVGASKKGKVWSPPDAKETAERRRQLVKDGRCIGDYRSG